jgi:hypothetical protein
MKTVKGIGFGHAFAGLASVALMGVGTGCASTGALDAREAAGAAEMQAPEGPRLRSGAVRVLDPQVNPLVPVRLTAEGDAIAVRFAHPRTGGAVLHVDGASLAPTGPEVATQAERREAPSRRPGRVVFRNGRFIECWKSGDAEHGYRVVAQAWTAGGDRIGAPINLSPPDADVLGTPRVVSVDDSHAVVAFTAVDGDKTELLAVPLQVL